MGNHTIIREKKPKIIFDSNEDEEKLIYFFCFKELAQGESMYLLGNHIKLGNLEIEKSIKMIRDDDNPIWRSEIKLKPNNYHYKFIIQNSENLINTTSKHISDFFWPIYTKSFDYTEDDCCWVEKQIRAMSFNLRYETKEDVDNLWINRKDIVTEVILKNLPDFLGTQEGLPNQINDIYDKICHLYEYWGVPREFNGESSGIFYRKDKFVFVDGGHFWLSDTPEISSKSFGNQIVRMCSWIKIQHVKKKYFKK